VAVRQIRSVFVVPQYPNAWMAVRRYGGVFHFYHGTDGLVWTPYLSVDTASTNLAGQDAGTRFGNPWPPSLYVGVAVTAHADGMATSSRFSDLQLVSPVQATAIGASVDVQNATVHAHCEASFHFEATNNAHPNVLGVTYAWYKNGAEMPGVTGRPSPGSRSRPTTAHKSTPWPRALLPLTASRLPVRQPRSRCLMTAYSTPTRVKLEVFANATRSDVENGNTGPGDAGYGARLGKLRWLPATRGPRRLW